jgi:NADP-dependent 3-hydroxy acid dehydrogenase YdfG
MPAHSQGTVAVAQRTTLPLSDTDTWKEVQRMTDRFVNKTVVVTGASSGIGEAIARRFSAEGANVVVAARRRERLDALVVELGPERTLAATTDVTQPADLDATMRAAAQRFGGIDILISNAGTALLNRSQRQHSLTGST